MNPTAPIQFGQIYITDAKVQTKKITFWKAPQQTVTLGLRLTNEDTKLAPLGEYKDYPFQLKIHPNQELTLTTRVPKDETTTVSRTIKLMNPEPIAPLLSKITQGVTFQDKLPVLSLIKKKMNAANCSDLGNAGIALDTMQKGLLKGVHFDFDRPLSLHRTPDLLITLNAFEQWIENQFTKK